MVSKREAAQAVGRDDRGVTGNRGYRRRAEQCRVRLLADGLLLEFRATLSQGRNFAEAIGKWPSEIHVLVDGKVSSDLPVLPYCRLWD
ncbi:hypothetical protein C5E45_19335 [Nocardia nova]|uniref:Uncharacterized protein n=1 Tax=Nocardia nova TaxID=37330 RepID=A0A2S6AMU1_9NOCA|nr:hypothetical protein [Nocardia nova]PPJ25799.1 hypothetical protein C5E41_19195 [Nocardia nova]PPJ36571.1 hypothetical protein C5E45_19335 [Nocardia nova]